MTSQLKIKTPSVAYFCSEFALDDALPTFAGGLGVLAGDIVQEAGAQSLPMTFIGLAYRRNVSVKTDEDKPIDAQLIKLGFELVHRGEQPLVIMVDFGSWSVALQAWQRQQGQSRLLLLDANLEANTPINRHLTANLYDPDLRTRLLQQFIMAEAGCQLLEALDLVPDIYHLNEGHMGMVAAVVALRYAKAHPGINFEAALEAVKPQIVATKHTILSGAGDFADATTIPQLFDEPMRHYGFSGRDLFMAGAKTSDPSVFSTTRLLIRAARVSTGVSILHCEAERLAHPHSPLIPITNGVYPPHWQQANIAGRSQTTTDAELWEMHRVNKVKMMAAINKELDTALSNDTLTVVWARRFAAYKRPTLMFSDIERLKRLVNDPDRPIQIIISGNANESDVEGMQVYEEIVRNAQSQDFSGRLVFLPHYATATSQLLAGGADLWLNTPIRGMEACGTSGMKAGLNGALHLTIADGWIDEVDITKIGWELPVDNTAGALYDLIEHEIAPQFYLRDLNGVPAQWAQKMRTSIEIVEQHYTTKRLLQDYYELLYQTTETVLDTNKSAKN